MTLSEAPASRRPVRRRSFSRWLRASSPDADHLLNVPCSLPRWIDDWYFSVDLRGSPRGLFPASLWPSRSQLPVGIHGELFEVCSSFTHVTARCFAHPPLWAWSEGFDAARSQTT